jgi:ABC-type sugar transport system ATPase subunit
MEAPAIRTEGPSKRYGTTDALKNLDLEVNRGDSNWPTADYHPT